jgi:hypothetical protein
VSNLVKKAYFGKGKSFFSTIVKVSQLFNYIFVIFRDKENHILEEYRKSLHDDTISL